MPAAAMAQSVCGDRDEIVDALDRAHGERKTAVALAASGGVVELFTAADGGWTLLYTLPGGVACLLAVGEAWEAWRPAPVEPRTRTH